MLDNNDDKTHVSYQARFCSQVKVLLDLTSRIVASEVPLKAAFSPCVFQPK